MTLVSSPALKLAEAAARQQGGVAQEQSGLFDPTLQALVSFENRSEDSADYRNGTFDLRLPKYFRSGFRVSPYADTAYSSTPLELAPAGPTELNLWTLTAGIEFGLPLLRNRGATAFAAAERGARAEADASRLTYEHEASVAALQTIQAYWDLRAEEESLAATQRSVDVAARLVDVSKSLVTAEELPRIELARAQAAEARARSTFSDAQRRVRDARVALVTVIGVTVADGDSALPRTLDPFPSVAPTAFADAAAAQLAAESVGRRLDVEASRKLDEAGRILEAGALRNKAPLLDLTADTWMTGLGADTISRAAEDWVGPSVNLGLQFEVPFGNNTLRGQAAQRSAEARQRQVSAADLTRRVQLEVLRIAAAVSETAARVQQAEVAAKLYQATVDAEIERFRVGETTLIDTLQSEQQLTDAQLTLASAQRDLAQLVAELRFQTGTLLPGLAVAGPNFISLPSGAGR
jgi:outer membrane protein TolC